MSDELDEGPLTKEQEEQIAAVEERLANIARNRLGSRQAIMAWVRLHRDEGTTAGECLDRCQKFTLGPVYSEDLEDLIKEGQILAEGEGLNCQTRIQLAGD